MSGSSFERTNKMRISQKVSTPIRSNRYITIFMRKVVDMKSKKIVCLALVTAVMGLSTVSYAQNHPRREQVNDRIENQNHRITKEVKEGEINHSQAQQLRQNDKAIRLEERNMAAQNGGHITKNEQRALNQQLNQNSGAIGK
jgi:uncharacterized protein HemX